jgi:hypothetical protein
MTDIARSGPFSTFPKVDRTIAVLFGTLRLTVGGQRVLLSADCAPLSFSGEELVIATPLDPPVVALNLMLRRGVCSGSLMKIADQLTLSIPQGGTRIVVAGERAIVCVNDEAYALCGHDTLIVNDPSLAPLVTATKGTAFAARLSMPED